MKVQLVFQAQNNELYDNIYKIEYELIVARLACLISVRQTSELYCCIKSVRNNILLWNVEYILSYFKS